MRLAASKAIALIGLGCGVGCEARTACDGFDAANASTSLRAELSCGVETGNVTLDAAGQEFNLLADVELRGLPELWPNAGAIERGSLGLQLLLSYEAEGLTANSATEMPVLEVTIGDMVAQRTTAFPAESSDFWAFLFGSCDSLQSAACCEFGSAACSDRVRLRVVRLEGAPFPPLRVDYRWGVGVSVNSCPLGSSPELSCALEVRP